MAQEAVKQKKKKAWWQVTLIWLGSILGVIVLALGIFLITLSATEYKPAPVESLEVVKEKNTTTQKLEAGKEIKLMSWNVGFGALGDNADFIYDGGDMIQTADEKRVKENLNSIIKETKEINPDIALFQEIDSDSDRTFKINEVKMFEDALPSKVNTYAYNFLVNYVPYPASHPFGKISSGIFTQSSFDITKSERIALPCPFSWPMKTCNLKRCLMVDEMPVENGKKLYVINLHLEAYDEGDGKKAQTELLLNTMNELAKGGNYVIAGGDFNQTFTSYMNDFPTLTKKSGQKEWKAGEIVEEDFKKGEVKWQFTMGDKDKDGNVTPSCRSLNRVYETAEKKDKNSFQYWQLDGFICSDNVKINKAEVKDLGFKNTDHNPLVMNVELMK